MITSDEERALLTLAKNGDRRASNRLCLEHRPFAIGISHQYRGLADENDLDAAAMWGLFEAIERFEITSHVRFLTYAVWHIRRRVMDVFRYGDTVRMPFRLWDKKVKTKDLSIVNETVPFDERYLHESYTNHDPLKSELDELIGAVKFTAREQQYIDLMRHGYHISEQGRIRGLRSRTIDLHRSTAVKKIRRARAWDNSMVAKNN